jgi:hypothetical protein
MPNKNIFIKLGILAILAALFRLSPDRPMGFSMSLAVPLISGALLRTNKTWAFIFSLSSMLISDILFRYLTNTQGFYSGQVINYILISSLTFVGFIISDLKLAFSASVIGPTLYFLASNSVVWLYNGGYHHPRTFDGFLSCLADGLPFYYNSLIGTLFFVCGFYILDAQFELFIKPRLKNRLYAKK